VSGFFSAIHAEEVVPSFFDHSARQRGATIPAPGITSVQYITEKNRTCVVREIRNGKRKISKKDFLYKKNLGG
jgi:hypothetical protein